MKRISLVAAVFVAVALLLLVVVHLPPVQRAAWRTLAERISEASSWQVRAGQLGLRLWPARLRARDIAVVTPDHQQLMTADHLLVSWSWFGLLHEPLRLDLVEVDGFTCDLRNLPELPAQQEPSPPPSDPLRLVEIGELRLYRGSADAAAAEVVVGLRDLEVDGRLAGGELGLELAAEKVSLARQGRTLDLGPLAIEVSGSGADGFIVERLSLDGDAASLRVDGRIEHLLDDPVAALVVVAEAEPGPLLAWWEPELAGRLASSGRLVLDGRVGFGAPAGLTFDLRHAGGPLQLAGYSLERLHLSGSAAKPSLTAAGASWGEINAALSEEGVAVALTLQRAAVDPALELARLELPHALPPASLLLSGRADVTLPLPIALEQISGSADLAAFWQGGRLQVQGRGGGGEVELQQLEAELPGCWLEGSAALDRDGTVSGEVDVTVDDLPALLAALGDLLPQTERLAEWQVGGGPLQVEVRLAGPYADPHLGLQAHWLRPAGFGVAAEGVRLQAAGSRHRLTWSLTADVLPGAVVSVSGDAEPLKPAAAGEWHVTTEQVEQLLALSPVVIEPAVSGALDAGGTFSYRNESWSLAGTASGRDLRYGPWGADLLSLTAEIDRTQLRLSAFEVRDRTAFIGGAGRVHLQNDQSPLELDLTWSDVDPATLPLDLPAAAAGRCDGELHLSGTRSQPSAALEVRWQGQVPDMPPLHVMLAAEYDGQLLWLSNLDVRAGIATLQGRGRAHLQDAQSPLELDLTWSDIEPAALPLGLPPAAAGRSSGELHLSGTRGQPAGQLRMTWQGQERSPLTSVILRAALADGTLRLVSEQLDTAAGSLVLQATVPLGGLPRPTWLWPDAPAGALAVELQGQQLSSAPLVAILGREPLPGRVTTDLFLDLRLDPADLPNFVGQDREQGQGEGGAARPAIDLRLENLQAETGGKQLLASGPITISLHDHRVELEPAELAGEGGHIFVAGSFDLDTRVVDAALLGEIPPELVRELSGLQASSPVRLSLEVTGPIAAPDGTLALEHAGGELLMRDPVVRITDLQMNAGLHEGVVTISDGSAGLNRGTMLIGGGWDPVSGQGLVLELEDVSFMLPMGILSRWDGLLAVEPDPDNLARVVGDLTLEAGLWDRPFDIAGAFFGGGIVTGVGPDDPLHEVVLDIDVEGRGGVRVDNNLGAFDVDWDLLHVGGTAALPLIEGRLRLAQGGTLSLSGKEITIARGTVEMTGEPGAEPSIEIVPQEAISVYGGGRDDDEAGAGTSAKRIAETGLARGIGSVLGLENKTLQPAEVSVETESDAGTYFVLGQRLSRRLALFLRTDLTMPQDRRTMLQLWNLRGLPGLALQVYDDSEGATGYAAFERLRWGGSKASEERPQIHRLRLAGDWPIGKRRLRKASGLSKGQPYDPFLLFVGGVRMEQELAAAGYHQARVSSQEEGESRLPTLVFSCEPGPYQAVVFTGDSLSRIVQRQIAALYQAPPLEKTSLNLMRDTVARHLAAKGFPETEVSVTRQDEEIVVDVSRGRKLHLEGPYFAGVPIDCVDVLRAALATPSDLATLLHQPERASRLIERLLHARGFHAAKLVRTWSEPVKKDRFRVRVKVDPGPRELLTEVRLVGEDPLGALARPDFALQPGSPLDRELIDGALRKVRRIYQEEAYTDVQVSSSTERLDSGDGWRLDLELQPGPQRKRSNLLITGLRHLRESLVRRAVRLQQGDLMRLPELDRSISDLAGFSPIERILVETSPEASDNTAVEVVVTEKPRWTAGLGARWTSDRGVESVLDLRDDNLLGVGASLNLRASWESERSYAALIAGLPARPGRRLSGLASLSYDDDVSKNAPDDLRKETVTATIEAQYRLTPSSTASVYYRFSRSTDYLKDPGPDNPLTIFFPIRTDVASLGGKYVLDRFDSPFDPRSGSYLATDVRWTASELGSDLDTLRSMVTGSLVLEPTSGWTWAQTVRVGAAAGLKGTNLDTEERFFAGGEASIRGFERDSVGPVTVGWLGEELPAGGGAVFILNEELRIPVWKQLRVAVFFDAGQVWEDWSQVNGDLSIGAGAGIRFATPIGPLWADVAWPVVNRGISEPGARFYIGIGRPF